MKTLLLIVALAVSPLAQDVEWERAVDRAQKSKPARVNYKVLRNSRSITRWAPAKPCDTSPSS